MTLPSTASLFETDREFLVHSLHTTAEHADPIFFVRGSGALLWDSEGREYIDGVSSLWVVTVGHGRRELARAAAEQIERLAYATPFVGSGNEPSVSLAARVVRLSYPNMGAAFFTTDGSEAVETAFKTARYFWKTQGRPEKFKIISCLYGYHGVTLAAMSATGIPRYWRMFEPRTPGFIHIPPPYSYQWPERLEADALAESAAAELEKAIQTEGPETVAGFIIEPVLGAGGTIVPPAGYFRRVREICDRYGVLLIADEVITAFCRTGRWFALDHWQVLPDIVCFAKGVTSGYVPLGGILMSKQIHRAIVDAPADSRFMHAFTYSGHPVACAVAMRNLDIMEQEGLCERATRLGKRLLDGLRALSGLPTVGEVRGLGMMASVELTADKATRAPMPAAVAGRLIHALRQRGLMARIVGSPERGPIICLAPPLVVTEQQIDRLVEIVGEAIPVAASD